MNPGECGHGSLLFLRHERDRAPDLDDLDTSAGLEYLGPRRTHAHSRPRRRDGRSPTPSWLTIRSSTTACLPTRAAVPVRNCAGIFLCERASGRRAASRPTDTSRNTSQRVQERPGAGAGDHERRDQRAARERREEESQRGDLAHGEDDRRDKPENPGVHEPDYPMPRSRRRRQQRDDDVADRRRNAVPEGEPADDAVARLPLKLAARPPRRTASRCRGRPAVSR